MSGNPIDDFPAYDEFALKVDALDYPIIALNRYVNTGAKLGFSITPNGAGFPPGTGILTWLIRASTTGRGVSMAIGTNDRLLLGYAMQEISRR